MGFVGVVFALFALGYVFGVWTALLVTKQPQKAYEDDAVVSMVDVPVIVLHRDAVTAARHSQDATARSSRP
ncbi:MAG TPA: hypothetical protein VNU27_10050 [Candidatus Acidoferrum sp.]|jgi:hypothetical protein|nr:hypothetical protein [Candidatus Acidoferrum sp.]